MTPDYAAVLAARLGPRLRYFPSTPSTQQEALAAARAGAPEGSLFVADRQTAGRGRHGHIWESPPAAGVYASLLLRPARPAASLLWLTLASGLALADAVAAVCGLQAELRWPNDLLYQGKKFCGLLIESAGEGREAALGFGINVRPAALPPELAPIATCLDAHLAAPCDRAELCAAAVEHLWPRYLAWQRGPAEDHAIRRAFESRSRYARGLAVTVDGAWSGVTEGLDSEGFLTVRTSSGVLRTVVSGDVRPATES